MSHKISYSILLIVTIVFILSCEKSSTVTPAESSDFVSFLDKGAVVPEPMSTLVTIDRSKIELVSSQNGITINYWSNKISNENYLLLTSIIKNNNLMNVADPTPSSNPGEICIGHKGARIIMRLQNTIDTINIPGQVICDRLRWPIGLDSLVALKDTLVNMSEP